MILWFRIFAVFMSVAYLVGGGVGMVSRSTALMAACALLAAFYAVAALVPFKPWGWTFALVAIGLGVASGAVVLAVPLLLHWSRPTTKAAFARL